MDLHLTSPQRHARVQSGATVTVAGAIDSSTSVDIEIRFAGGSWTTLAEDVSGSFSANYAPVDGYGSMDVRFAGDTLPLSSVGNIDVGVQFDLLDSGTLITHPASGQTWLGRPILYQLASGVWMLLYRQATNHGDDSTAQLHIRFSQNEGVSWTANNTFTDGQPCVGVPFLRHNSTFLAEGTVIQSPNGDLLVHTTERPGAGIHQFRSVDFGKNWADEGRINNDTTLIGGDWCVVAGVIYTIWRYDAGSDFAHPHIAKIFTSADDGDTWVELSTVQANFDINEPSILHLGGANFLSVVRNAYNTGTAHQYVSANTCATWTYSNPGAVLKALHRPKMRTIDEGILLFGRDNEAEAVEGIAVFLSADNGLTWRKRFLVVEGMTDGGYCDVLRRDDDTFYMVSYAGDTNVADLTWFTFELP
jgi:hypothetical protein